MRLDSASQIQDRLQRNEFVIGKRSQRLLNDLQILILRRRLQAHRQCESGIVGHRRQFFGQLLVRFSQAGDKRVAGGGNRLTFG